jgi:hypothetical protein
MPSYFLRANIEFNMKVSMNLLEILNTKADVKWTTSGHQHFGEFKLDGDESEYVIQIDEYDSLGKVLVDLGFTTNGNIVARNDKKTASKVIGAVLNGSVERLNKINPDAILVRILKSSGLAESRKSLYSTILVWASRRFGYSFQTNWLENSKMFYMIASKEALSKEEIQVFSDQVTHK